MVTSKAFRLSRKLFIFCILLVGLLSPAFTKRTQAVNAVCINDQSGKRGECCVMNGGVWFYDPATQHCHCEEFDDYPFVCN